MNLDLVCKIIVKTNRGEELGGSGYPITANRIITAAHIVADARNIEVFFGEKKADSLVYVEWSGEKIDVDVAVLRCQLPRSLQPVHRLLGRPPGVPMRWFAHGYTEYGRQKTPRGIDNYSGTLSNSSLESSTVDLACPDGPVTAEQWKGGSGSVLFDLDTGQVLLGVITGYISGKKLDHLAAVPIWHLLKDQGFCRAIRYDEYRRGEEHRKCVIGTITSKLVGLAERLPQIAERICELVGAQGGAHQLDLKSNTETLAKQVAGCIVDQCKVDEAVRVLVGMLQDLGPREADAVADVVDHLLPLNYAPQAIQHLREHLHEGGLGLVEGEVATPTLAEVIMAGYDGKAARFVEMRGQSAMCVDELPEEGPGALEAAGLGELRAVRSFLHDLVALKDEILRWLVASSRQRDRDVSSPAAIQREIDAYAAELRGSLDAMTEDMERTVYCVMVAPPDSARREFRNSILRVVHEKVPQLVFVELIPPERADPREFKVRTFIQLRLIRCRVK